MTSRVIYTDIPTLSKEYVPLGRRDQHSHLTILKLTSDSFHYDTDTYLHMNLINKNKTPSSGYVILLNNILSFYASSASKTIHNLLTGRVSVAVRVFISALRTRPSASGNTSMTLASGHDPLGREGSTIRVTSSFWTFLSGCNHFCLACSSGKYSLDHLFQNWSARNCICLHRRRT